MNWIIPNWNAPAKIKALSTVREGGSSDAPFNGLNLGHHVGDNPAHVAQNRATLVSSANMPTAPVWLNQVHGVNVLSLPYTLNGQPDADAVYTNVARQVCAIMTADCLPVLLCNGAGNEVCAVHAGWKGLLNGVVENALDRFADSHGMHAWLGPAIGPQAFEVGDEVRQAFVSRDARAKMAFIAHGSAWLADIYQLARLRLQHKGVDQISGGEYCTFSDPSRFYSYRREPVTGRQASCIWIEPN